MARGVEDLFRTRQPLRVARVPVWMQVRSALTVFLGRWVVAVRIKSVKLDGKLPPVQLRRRELRFVILGETLEKCTCQKPDHCSVTSVPGL